MLERKSYILLFAGALGVITFFFLRPYIDFNSNGPILESKGDVESRIVSLSNELGFSMDSLAMMTVRQQHGGYVDLLRDTLKEEIYPSTLNKRGAHIQSWLSIVGYKDKVAGFLTGTNSLFSSYGQLKIRYSNEGRLIRFQSHPENYNPTFLKGDSLQSIAINLVGQTLGYNLEHYDLIEEGSAEDSVTVFAEGQSPKRTLLNSVNGNSSEGLELQWKRKPNMENGPQHLSLVLAPVVKEFDNEEGFRTEFGFSVVSFTAKNDLEPEDLTSSQTDQDDEIPLFTYLFFINVFVLGILVFSMGLRNIFKGKVEWRRALFIFGAIALGLYGWRSIYFLYTYDPFLNNAGVFGAVLNNLLFALVAGLYGALAYITWEALARKQNNSQVNVIDALWQRKFFVSETGAGLVHGIAVGGVAIGIFAVITYLSGEYIIQTDSQFGFSEPSIPPKLLTINMTAWTTTWLVCFAQIGFVYVLVNEWVSRKWLSGVLSIVFVALLIGVLGRLTGTSGEVANDLLIYLGIAIIFVYAIQEYGLLTVCTGWWLFASFFMIMPYLNSPSIEIAYVSWVQFFIMAGPLIYGFIAYRYGVSVSEVGNYIPEYEERIAQHLRVEKEIEIARESQYKLMPLQAPKAEGIDVYGFFLPSFEVGGDYFDYVLSDDESGNPEALTMTVVDVSGKAMRAAMPAVFTSGLLLSRMKRDTPAEILTQVSEPIYSRTDKRTFITCGIARYEIQTGKMAIANAGHCLPVLKRNGKAEFIQTPEPRYPLGLKKEVAYQPQEFNMKKGDFFLMYSDGLPEALNEKGERFGFDQVPRLIEEIDTENLTAQEVAQEIKRTVQKYSNYQLADDTTIICLKI